MSPIFNRYGFNTRSAWLHISILLIVLITLANPGAHLASAAPAITIRVNTTTDSNTSNTSISLREAILLVNGGTGGNGTRTGLGRPLSTQENALISGGSIGATGVAANIVFSDLPGLSIIAITSGTGSANESLPPVLTSGVVINGATGVGTPVTLDGSSAPAATDVLWLGWDDPSQVPVPTIPVSNITVQTIAITGAKRYGIHLDPARNSLVSGCSVTGSASYAIYINGKYDLADHDIIENCTVGNNSSLGVVVNRPNSNNAIIRNNRIGTNASGTAAAPNTGAGIALFTGTNNVQISGNVISGNTLQGIYLDGTAGAVSHNTITNNKIGTAADGVTPIPNVQGIVFGLNSSLNTVGGTGANQANIIAFNTQSGVVVVGDGSTGNRISGNSIFQNGILGIDLLDDKLPTQGTSGGTAGPNQLALRPTLTKAMVRNSIAAVKGTASPNSTIEIFVAAPDLSGFGSGKVYCASVTADGSGAFNFFGTIKCAPGSAPLTATSTLGDGSTSEFGNNLAVT
ncbi:MAG TPA: right-handed parallel beta-helix repeat-containing protein, partial [Anaerolineaceae bacterium]|nr:right-handed parallel beta-helix repeat-containing protein [Anaerolineaceae bacterium]